MQNKKERRKGFVYIIRNTVNDKVYIGQTTQSIEERFKQHLRKNKLLTKDFLENHKDLFNYQIAEMMGVNEATVTRAFQKHGITIR